MKQPWDIPAAISLYNIDRWGTGYFTINEKGNIQVQPTRGPASIDIMDVIEDAKAQGLTFPLVLRFQDLLRDRVETINKAFATAIKEANYRNEYRGVFPIKVNQLREVVEEIVDAGTPYKFGIEAGSKPELIAALAIHRDPESLIICNGYKDKLFIENALLGRKLGKKVILVVEKIEELAEILRVSKEVGVEPMIGIRVRLSTKGAGKWATSGGENARRERGLISSAVSPRREQRAHHRTQRLVRNRQPVRPAIFRTEQRLRFGDWSGANRAERDSLPEAARRAEVAVEVLAEAGVLGRAAPGGAGKGLAPASPQGRGGG